MQTVAKGLIRGITELYPCKHCREDFKESVKEDPPRCEGGALLACMCLCELRCFVAGRRGA